MIKKLTELGKGDNQITTSKPQDVSDVVMSKARKEYYDIIAFLRNKGVKVDITLANKIKEDVIEHQQILNL